MLNLRKYIVALVFLTGVWGNISVAFASSRVKDIADFEGVRENQLIGYGLVVGLNGTGDNIKSISPCVAGALQRSNL